MVPPAIEDAVQQVRDKLQAMPEAEFLSTCERAHYQIRPPEDKGFPTATGKLMIKGSMSVRDFLQKCAWDFQQVRAWVIDDVCDHAFAKPDQFAGFRRVLDITLSSDPSLERIADGVNSMAVEAKRISEERQGDPWYRRNAGIIGIIVTVIIAVVGWIWFG